MGGVEPRYNISSNVLPNVPSNALCMLTLKDNSNVYITGENSLMAEVIQPYQEDVVSAIITNRCTSIEENAFMSASHLTSVIIPDSVTSIGSSVFMNCTSLSSVTLPNTITKLGISVFEQCTSLEHISLPNTLKEIGWYVFQNCGLKKIIIPEGVTKLGSSVVNSCPNLESITFPSSIETVLKDGWFYACEKLREIKIIGTKNMSDILPFDNVNNNSDLTLYVDSSLVDTYKAKRDSNNGVYKILPLQQ